MTIEATVNTQNILDNYDAIHNVVGGALVAPVVKADAYGLGAKLIVELLESKKPPLYYVATLDEAIDIRPLTSAEIVVFGGIQKSQERDFLEYNLCPALKSLEDLLLWQKEALKQGALLPCQIHLDTGMNRTGVQAYEDSDLTSHLDGVDIRAVISHFVSSEEDENSLNRWQREGFLSRTVQYELAYGRDVNKSLCNSSGIFNFPDCHFDFVRPGGALWGIEMAPGQASGLKPALSLEAKVLQVSHIKSCDSVGYNQMYTADIDHVIATVAMGYADGVPWPATNSAKLYWKGHACPVVGSVSMDLMTVMLPDELPEDEYPVPGDMIEVIGENQRIETLAKDCGARAYEMQIALGNAKRLNKNYL